MQNFDRLGQKVKMVEQPHCFYLYNLLVINGKTSLKSLLLRESYVNNKLKCCITEK